MLSADADGHISWVGSHPRSPQLTSKTRLAKHGWTFFFPEESQLSCGPRDPGEGVRGCWSRPSSFAAAQSRSARRLELPLGSLWRRGFACPSWWNPLGVTDSIDR